MDVVYTIETLNCFDDIGQFVVYSMKDVVSTHTDDDAYQAVVSQALQTNSRLPEAMSLLESKEYGLLNHHYEDIGVYMGHDSDGVHHVLGCNKQVHVVSSRHKLTAVEIIDKDVGRSVDQEQSLSDILKQDSCPVLALQNYSKLIQLQLEIYSAGLAKLLNCRALVDERLKAQQ